MMPREELDAIQAKLKVAIQNHQIVVAKIKSDSQNDDYKAQLHTLQSQITSLSDQQRLVVERLRQELMHTDQSPTSDLTQCLPQPAHQQSRGPPAAHSGSPPASLHSPLSAVFGDSIAANATPADLSVKADKPTGPPQKSPSHPIIHKPTPVMAKKSVHSPLRVPNVSCLKNNMDTPLFINTSPPTLTTPVSKDSNNERPYATPTTLASGDKKPLSHKQKRKLEFMASMDLVTMESVKDIQAKRCERRHHTTANPQFAGHTESEKKRIIYLMSPPGNKKPKGKTSKPNGFHSENDATDVCIVCRLAPTPDSPLVHCDLCYGLYHAPCVTPPLTAVPFSPWACPACEKTRKCATLNAENMAIVHTFIASKAVREEEKKLLQKRGIALVNEKILLERHSAQLTDTLNKHIQEKSELLAYNKSVEESVNNLKNFVKIFRS